MYTDKDSNLISEKPETILERAEYEIQKRKITKFSAKLTVASVSDPAFL